MHFINVVTSFLSYCYSYFQLEYEYIICFTTMCENDEKHRCAIVSWPNLSYYIAILSCCDLGLFDAWLNVMEANLNGKI